MEPGGTVFTWVLLDHKDMHLLELKLNDELYSVLDVVHCCESARSRPDLGALLGFLKDSVVDEGTLYLRFRHDPDQDPPRHWSRCHVNPGFVETPAPRCIQVVSRLPLRVTKPPVFINIE